MKLLNWIDETKLNFDNLALNPNAIDYFRNKTEKDLTKKQLENLAKNPNGYLVLNNINLFENKDLKKLFIIYSPYIESFENIINEDDYYWLCKNKNAKTLINKYQVYEKEKLYYLLCGNNPIFIDELKKYTNNDPNATKEFLNCCAMEVLNLFDIPGSEDYINLMFPNLENSEVCTDKSFVPCVDQFNLNSFKYSPIQKYVETGLKYILYGNGLIHKHEGNMKLLCNSLTTNELSYPIIDFYLQNNLLNKQQIYDIFFALSSKENNKAIELLKKYYQYINWSELSKNCLAIDLLFNNQDKIDYNNLSSNKAIFI